MLHGAGLNAHQSLGSPGNTASFRGAERERPTGEKFMGVARSHFVIDEQGKIVDVQYNVAPENSPTLSIPLL